MKTGLVLLAAALLAVVVNPAFAQSRTRTSDSVSRARRDANPTIVADRRVVVSSSRVRTSVSRGRGYRQGNQYQYRYNGGYAGPLAIGGAAAATALKSSPAGVIGGVVLGWLLGQYLDNVKAQQPVELVEWFEDSTGNRYWQKSGNQTRVARPEWVGQPTVALPEQSNEPAATPLP